MKEKTLLKLALICSLSGIIVLFFISERISIKEIDISKINEEETGKIVKLVGRIESVNDANKTIFLEIGQEKVEKVAVILFKDSDLALAKGDYVEITGSIEDYEGEREIIASRVRII